MPIANANPAAVAETMAAASAAAAAEIANAAPNASAMAGAAAAKLAGPAGVAAAATTVSRRSTGSGRPDDLMPAGAPGIPPIDGRLIDYDNLAAIASLAIAKVNDTDVSKQMGSVQNKQQQSTALRLEQLQKQKEAQEKEDEAKKSSWWQKILGIVLIAVSAVATVVLPGLGAMALGATVGGVVLGGSAVVGLTALVGQIVSTVTGKDLPLSLGKLWGLFLKACGVPENVAQTLGSLTDIAVTLASAVVAVKAMAQIASTMLAKALRGVEIGSNLTGVVGSISQGALGLETGKATNAADGLRADAKGFDSENTRVKDELKQTITDLQSTLKRSQDAYNAAIDLIGKSGATSLSIMRDWGHSGISA